MVRKADQSTAIAFGEGNGNGVEVAVVPECICNNRKHREGRYKGVDEEAVGVESRGDRIGCVTNGHIERHGSGRLSASQSTTMSCSSRGVTRHN